MVFFHFLVRTAELDKKWLKPDELANISIWVQGESLFDIDSTYWSFNTKVELCLGLWEVLCPKSPIIQHRFFFIFLRCSRVTHKVGEWDESNSISNWVQGELLFWDQLLGVWSRGETMFESNSISIWVQGELLFWHQLLGVWCLVKLCLGLSQGAFP